MFLDQSNSFKFVLSGIKINLIKEESTLRKAADDGALQQDHARFLKYNSFSQFDYLNIKDEYILDG